MHNLKKTKIDKEISHLDLHIHEVSKDAESPLIHLLLVCQILGSSQA